MDFNNEERIDTPGVDPPGDRIVDGLVIDTLLGPVRIGFSHRGLCSVAFDDGLGPLLTEGRSSGPVAVWSDEIRRRAAGEAPRRRIPVAASCRAAMPAGAGEPSFRVRIWQLIESIPHGQTWSYGQLARKAGMPRAARAVAQACAANPLLLVVPCHRVIRSDGTSGGYRGGVTRKRALLESERQNAILFA